MFCTQSGCGGWMSPLAGSEFRKIIVFKCKKCGYELSMPRKHTELWVLSRFISGFR